MNLKNLFNLLLIAIISFSVSSCENDDEPIEGSWLYQGIYRIQVRTNHPALTRAIEIDIEDYTKDYEHALVFDGEKMMKMYGYQIDYSAYYTYRYHYSELTLDFGKYYETHEFNINRDIALLRTSYIDDYSYEDGYIYEDMIYYLMNKFPFLQDALRGVDLRTLYIEQVDVQKKYLKIE